MTSLRATWLALLLAATAAPALATPVRSSPPPAPVPPPPPVLAVPHYGTAAGAAAPKRTPADPAMIEAMMSKLFPAMPDPDPARLALAQQSVALMWPDGSYERSMSNLFDTMFSNLMKMRRSDIPAASGTPKKAAAGGLNDPTFHEAASAKDPNFDKHIAAMKDVIHDQMREVSAVIDPRMREGLSRSMARRFDAAQLRDINAFFATPSGRVFAAQSMQLWMDPDAFRAMMTALPTLMKMTPVMQQRMKTAAENLPKPPASGASKP